MTDYCHYPEIPAAFATFEMFSRKVAASRRQTDMLSMVTPDTYTWRANVAEADREMTIRVRLPK